MTDQVRDELSSLPYGKTGQQLEFRGAVGGKAPSRTSSSSSMVRAKTKKLELDARKKITGVKDQYRKKREKNEEKRNQNQVIIVELKDKLDKLSSKPDHEWTIDDKLSSNEYRKRLVCEELLLTHVEDAMVRDKNDMDEILEDIRAQLTDEKDLVELEAEADDEQRLQDVMIDDPGNRIDPDVDQWLNMNKHLEPPANVTQSSNGGTGRETVSQMPITQQVGDYQVPSNPTISPILMNNSSTLKINGISPMNNSAATMTDGAIQVSNGGMQNGGTLSFHNGIPGNGNLPLRGNMPPENQQQPTVNNSSNEVVGQLVSALSQAFGSRGNGADRRLPQFDGNPCDWGNFYAAFQRTTTKYNFDYADNMSRLQDCLKGNAKKTVEHLMANVNNLPAVINTLWKRYGQPEYVLDHLIEKAKTCRNVELNKPETTVEFGMAVEALVTNICNYNESDYMSNKQLVTELLKKLPGPMRDKWYEWRVEDSNRKTNLFYFNNWLKVRVEAALLQVKPCSADWKREEKRDDWRSKRGPANVHITSSEAKVKKQCVLCNRVGHELDKCYEFAKYSYDEKWNNVRKLRLCFQCLEKGHNSNNCSSKIKCTKDDCTAKHHPLLHKNNKSTTKPDERKSSDGNEIEKKPEQPTVNKETNTMNVSIVKGTDGSLPILPVLVQGPNGVRRVYAMLDNGATTSLIEKDLVADLGLEGKQTTFKCRGFGGHLTEDPNAKLVKVQVRGAFRGSNYFGLSDVVAVDKIGVQPYTLDMEEAKRKWPQLRRMRCSSMNNVVPKIIIGSKHRHLTVPREILCSDLDGPVASRTLLGWVLEGDLKEENVYRTMYMMQQNGDLDQTMDTIMREYFEVESFGIKPSMTNSSIEDKRAMVILEQTTRGVGNHWEIGLLWRDANPTLPESENIARKRLWCLEREFQRKPELKVAYFQKIDEYLQKGYIRKLEPDEVSLRDGKTWYNPTFGVTNVNKPGKLRLVFDVASKLHGVSLNDKLLTGPDLLRRQTTVLWNFRRHVYVISGDIEDMFPRVSIIQEDINSQRFLLRNQKTNEIETFAMVVMMFGSKCSPASAIYVLIRNAKEFEQQYPKAVDTISNDTYMDDILTGADTVEDAISLRKDITFVNEQGNFYTKKWISNNKEIMKSIPEELQLPGNKSMNDKNTIASERVLGLWWDPDEDVFTFKTNFQKIDPEILKGKHPTKREMLRLIMSVYDPLGFIGQYRVKGMIIMQNTWRLGTGWDEIVSEEVYDCWKNWVNELQSIKLVKVPRKYAGNFTDADNIELHVFVDASEEAFCAVAYFRVVKCSSVCVSLVASKVRVASLKKMTIPRLELQAAVLGAKLADAIREEIRVKINKFFFWSDSRTVLCWIRSESSRYKEFVANRIGAIQELSNVCDWHWVPTEENVADDATRLNKPTEFLPTARWYSGPAFLHEMNRDSWNFEENNTPGEPRTALSVQKETRGDDSGISLAFSRCGLESGVSEKQLLAILPLFERFSSCTRLLRATATVRIAARKWMYFWHRHKIYDSWDDEMGFQVTPALLDLAEKTVLRKVQMQAFREDVMKLTKNIDVTLDKNSNLSNLAPFLNKDGILRAKGRIDRAHWISEEQRRPIILPAKHHVTDLIIDREHRLCAHTGQATVLSNLRQKFWIVSGRQAVKRCWSKCFQCRMERAKPNMPLMGDLPLYRMKSYQPAFTFTGVDYFGPLGVLVGRRHEKRWGVLFTCLVTRGIHLEVAHALSTDEFIMALTRFISTRGRPYLLVSDNGTNFRGAANELRLELERLDLEKVMKLEKFGGIKHTFLPPAAPYMGGVYERLIQSVKKVLSRVLKEKYPKDSTLLTVLKEAEFIVNSRPITYVSGDVNDEDALTPNHFLRGATDRGPAVPAFPEDRDEFLRKSWKYAQLMAKRFWDRWTSEYLPEIMMREKWTENGRSLEVGDIVVLVDDQAPRNCWSKGVISAVSPGKDGVVRVVEVTTRKFGKEENSVFTRPVSKIIPTGLKMEKTVALSSALGSGNIRK